MGDAAHGQQTFNASGGEGLNISPGAGGMYKPDYRGNGNHAFQPLPVVNLRHRTAH